jgi:hypothetical protein
MPCKRYKCAYLDGQFLLWVLKLELARVLAESKQQVKVDSRPKRHLIPEFAPARNSVIQSWFEMLSKSVAKGSV